jgi:hypothetical protein
MDKTDKNRKNMDKTDKNRQEQTRTDKNRQKQTKQKTKQNKTKKDNSPRACHVSGIPLQKGFFPFCKGEKWRCLAGEERRLPFEGKKIPAHMTRVIVRRELKFL